MKFLKTSVIAASALLSFAASAETVKITNNPWSIAAHKLSDELKMDWVHLVNDFAAQSMAVILLKQNDLVPVGKLALPDIGSQQEQTFCVVGPGTGLGVGGLLVRDNHCSVLQTEGGHAGFAAHSPEDIEILKYQIGRAHV